MGINHTKDYTDTRPGQPYYPQRLERDEMNYVPTRK